MLFDEEISRGTAIHRRPNQNMPEEHPPPAVLLVKAKQIGRQQKPGNVNLIMRNI